MKAPAGETRGSERLGMWGTLSISAVQGIVGTIIKLPDRGVPVSLFADL